MQGCPNSKATPPRYLLPRMIPPRGEEVQGGGGVRGTAGITKCAEVTALLSLLHEESRKHTGIYFSVFQQKTG